MDLHIFLLFKKYLKFSQRRFVDLRFLIPVHFLFSFPAIFIHTIFILIHCQRRYFSEYICVSRYSCSFTNSKIKVYQPRLSNIISNGRDQTYIPYSYYNILIHVNFIPYLFSFTLILIHVNFIHSTYIYTLIHFHWYFPFKS